MGTKAVILDLSQQLLNEIWLTVIEWNLIDCNSFKHFIMDKWDGIFIAAFNVLYGHRSTNDVHTCPVSSWFLFSACLSFSGMLLIIPNKCKGPIQRAQLDYHEKK